MQGRLVCHSKLTYVACLVGKLRVKLPLAPTHALGKGLVEVADKFFPATHQIDEVGEIMLDIPPVCPSIVLVVYISCPKTSAKAIVEIREEVPVLVLGVEELCIRIPYVTVVVTELEVFPLRLLVAKELRYA